MFVYSNMAKKMDFIIKNDQAEFRSTVVLAFQTHGFHGGSLI